MWFCQKFKQIERDAIFWLCPLTPMHYHAQMTWRLRYRPISIQGSWVSQIFISLVSFILKYSVSTIQMTTRKDYPYLTELTGSIFILDFF